IAPKKSTQRIPGLLYLSFGHAHQRGFRRLPDGSSRAESGLLAHRAKCQGGGLRLENWLDLVGHRHGAGNRLFCLRLSLVRREDFCRSRPSLVSWVYRATESTDPSWIAGTFAASTGRATLAFVFASRLSSS